MNKSLFVLLTILILFNLSFAVEKVFTVTVKRIMGERDSRDDIREIATLEAKRQALEQAGTYLETETVMRDYKLAKDEVIALTAGVVESKVADESWGMIGSEYGVHLTYEISIDLDDVERKLEALHKDRQKMDGQKRLQAENERFLAEMGKLKQQLENASKNQVPELKQKRKLLSDEFMATEWFKKAKDTDNTDKEIEYCTKAIELNPNYVHAYNYRGTAYDDKCEYDLAIADYNRAIEIDPNFAFPYLNRGITYYNKGEYDREIDEYTKGIKCDTTDAEAYILRGDAYYDKGEYNCAIEDYTKAIDIDTNLVDAYYNRGNAYKKKGDYDSAIADYTKTIEIDPDYKNAYRKRGYAYLRTGNLILSFVDFVDLLDPISYFLLFMLTIKIFFVVKRFIYR